MSSLTTLTVGSPANTIRQEKDTDWKGTNKTAPMCIWHDYIHKKSQGNYKNTLIINNEFSKFAPYKINIQKVNCALAGVVQSIESWPANPNQRVPSSIPSLDTCLGCRPGPEFWGMWEATNQCISCISTFPSLSPSFPLSKNK